MKNQKVLAAGANAPAAAAQSRPPNSAATYTLTSRRLVEEGYATIHTGRPTKARRLSPAATPEKVLQAFNTWAFKREQPDNPQRILQVITEAMQLAKPVPFVLYWGKGPRFQLGEPDTTCLNFLDSLAARIRSVYEPGASFTLIFTDTHADLNGHAPEAIADYFGAVEAAAHGRGFDNCWLSELVFAAEAANALEAIDEKASAETLQKLGQCAAKWYRGEGTCEEGATRYFRMNMIEKRAVQFAFPRSIFITFNGSEYRCLFPDRLPIFYMYSLRRGMSVKPWFLPAPAKPAMVG